MKKSFSAVVFALLLATLTNIAQAQSCPSSTTCTPPVGNFQFTNVDVPGATFTLAGGINNRGQIAGFFKDSANLVHGYVQDGNNIISIEVPNAHKTFPATINDAGTVAGAFSDGVNFHGFVLEKGKFTTIDFPGAILTEVVDINDRGDMVGAYLDPSFGLHGFILDKNGFTSIDDPAQGVSSPSTQSFGINNRRIVNGLFLDDSGNSHGFVLSRGVFTTVDVPGAIGTDPSGLNNSDDQVGFYVGPDNVQHGYLQRDDDFVTFDFPGGVTFPFQINDSGTILGIYHDAQGLTHSFIANQLRGDDHDGTGNGSLPAIRTAPAQTCSPSGAGLPVLLRHPLTCLSSY